MRVLARARLHDHVGERTVRRHVLRVQEVVRHDAPPLARVRHLRDVPGIRRARPRTEAKEPQVARVRVVEVAEVGVDAPAAEPVRGLSRALQGELARAEEGGLRAGRRRDVGVAGRVDERLGAHAPDAERRGHVHRRDRAVLRDGPHAHRAEHHLHARVAAPLPQRLGAPVESVPPADLPIPLLERLGVSAVVAVEIAEHHAVRRDATEDVQVLDEQDPRTGASRRERGGGAARAAAHDHHVVRAPVGRRGLSMFRRLRLPRTARLARGRAAEGLAVANPVLERLPARRMPHEQVRVVH